MIINKEVISKLNPCKDRFDNYLTHYNDKDFTINQFMGLKHILHSDKLWVAFRLLPKDKIRFVAADIADIADMVLHIFEEAYPNDLRPRKAIEAARRPNFNYGDAYSSAYAASWAANRLTDRTSLVAHSASSAAFVCLANEYPFCAAASYAAAVAEDRNLMEKRQRTLLIKYLKGVVCL